MSDFSWDELPEERVADKKPKRDEIPRSEIPDVILAKAETALKDQKFHYQQCPDREVAALFLNLIRACGDYTTPQSTVLASLGTYTVNTKKWEPKDTGKHVRYSVGIRRGRKTDESPTDGAQTSDGAETGAETGAEATENGATENE